MTIPIISNSAVLGLTLARKGVTLLDGGLVHNPNTSTGYLHFFDAAATADVTLGTTVPVLSVQIFSGASFGLQDLQGVTGTRFINGLVLAATDNKGADATNTNITTGFEVDMTMR
jgi:hypothetical protein